MPNSRENERPWYNPFIAEESEEIVPNPTYTITDIDREARNVTFSTSGALTAGILESSHNRSISGGLSSYLSEQAVNQLTGSSQSQELSISDSLRELELRNYPTRYNHNSQTSVFVNNNEFNVLSAKVEALLATITELKEDNAYLKAVLDEEFGVKTRGLK